LSFWTFVENDINSNRKNIYFHEHTFICIGLNKTYKFEL
jgi:hypothetical protein